jgi:hypothetical protein
VTVVLGHGGSTSPEGKPQGPTEQNPNVPGNKILASPRSHHIYFMPADTPGSVVSSMQVDGENVALLPEQDSTPGVTMVSRSYWSFGNDDLGDHDPFGYGGPTDTPGSRPRLNPTRCRSTATSPPTPPTQT